MCDLMKFSNFSKLPPPPSGKIGWPWTEVNRQLPKKMTDGSEWPRISIVTPSYNQGEFIEETIRSVLLQSYPNLEYIIIDGGSTDNSVEIIKKYESYLAYWVSEPDKGQSHALNKGFRKATGELVGWQNSDDYYHPQAFEQTAIASKIFKKFNVIYGSTDNVDINGNFLRRYPVSEFDLDKMIPHLNMCNQSLFFHKIIFDENNFIDESLEHAMDLDFFIKLAVKGYQFKFSPDIKGYYRIHGNAKTSKQYDIYSQDCIKIYKNIYNNKTLPVSIRRKAINCIYGLCLDNFRVLKLDNFRRNVKELATLAWLKIFAPRLIFQYIISFLGERNLKSIKYIYSKLQ